MKPVRSAIKSLRRLHAKHIEKICAKVGTVMSYLIVKNNKASAQGFGDWVCEAIAGGARKAHRYTTKDAALPSLPMYETIDGKIVSDPLLLIQERARRWMVLWSKRQEQFEELNDAIQNVIRLARDGDGLPEVTSC